MVIFKINIYYHGNKNYKYRSVKKVYWKKTTLNLILGLQSHMQKEKK